MNESFIFLSHSLVKYTVNRFIGCFSGFQTILFGLMRPALMGHHTRSISFFKVKQQSSLSIDWNARDFSKGRMNYSLGPWSHEVDCPKVKRILFTNLHRKFSSFQGWTFLSVCSSSIQSELFSADLKSRVQYGAERVGRLVGMLVSQLVGSSVCRQSAAR